MWSNKTLETLENLQKREFARFYQIMEGTGGTLEGAGTYDKYRRVHMYIHM